MRRLAGQTALVTGASRGLGLGIAETLAREGVHLLLTARSEGPLLELARRLTDLGVEAHPIAADISTASGRAAIVSGCEQLRGLPDIVVHNAGVESIGRFDTRDPATIEQIITVNVLAPMLLTRALLPGMVERGSGHIVTISSLAGKKGLPYNSIYAASKAAATSWAWGLREELRDTGVVSSVISPGYISEAGMFAEYHTPPHWLAGESPPNAVSRAVVAALKKEKSELIVSPGPVKLMMLLDALSPDLVSWLLRRFGLYRFYRELATRLGDDCANERERTS